MLAEILKKTDDELVATGEEYRKFFSSNVEKFKIEYKNYFDTPQKNISFLVSDFIKIYQLFSYNEDKISTFIREKLVSFYLSNIFNLILNREEFTIYSFIDIFYCDPLFFQNKQSLITFFEVTYPILFIETKDMSSFIAIASMRYIVILGSEKEGRIFLERYLNENKKGVYIEDVEEELE